MRLIDADLLVKYFTENSNDLQGSEWFITNILDAINSAPAVSGEAVGIVTGLSIAGNPREFEWYKPVRLGEKLHLAPPQPSFIGIDLSSDYVDERVNEALDKAAKICDEITANTKYQSITCYDMSNELMRRIRKLIIEDK